MRKMPSYQKSILFWIAIYLSMMGIAILLFGCSKELNAQQIVQTEHIKGKSLIKDSIGIELGQTKAVYRFDNGDTMYLTLKLISIDAPCPSPDAICVKGQQVLIWFSSSIPDPDSGSTEWGVFLGGEMYINIDSTDKGDYIAFTDIIRYNLGGRKNGRIAILRPVVH